MVFAVAEAPKTLGEINAEIPPHDASWTEAIVGDVIERGWVRALSTNPPRFELTEAAVRMLQALEEIPAKVKENAWKSIWMPEPPGSV